MATKKANSKKNSKTKKTSKKTQKNTNSIVEALNQTEVKNLITGIVILFLAGLFSIQYFSSRPQPEVSNTPFLDESDLNGQQADFMQNGELDTAVRINSTTGEQEEIAIVQEGESLWAVSERVCGSGEDYVYMAEANGFSIWWAPIQPGDELVVDCGE